MAEVSDITTLITDDSADPDELQRLRDAGVEVVLA
jgi:DeoR/GlpR family transcriptional regulator of sugar metabolism